MAEATALRNNALPYPVYGAPWTVVFPLLDADGDLVTGGGGDTPDSEVSKNGDTFADCSNEMTEIATASGMYYLILTATEMTADIVTVICKTATAGTKTTPIVLYPRKLVALSSGTSQGGAVGYITLAAATLTINDQFNGCLCVATIDGNVESRVLQVCTSGNQQCTVTPNWNVAPDVDDTYIIYLPEGMQIPESDVTAISGDSTAADNLESACDNYSATRGLTGTALPAVAADAAGGLPISDAGGLDLDDIPKRVDRNADLVESQRGSHTWQGDYYYVDPVNGNDSTGDGSRALPYATIQAAHDDLITDNNHDVIFLVSGAASGATTHTVAATTTISKNYVFLRGPGRNFIITRTGSGDTLAITGDGVEISGARIATAATGSGDGIDITDADFARIHHCWFLDTRGDGVHILRGNNCQVHDNNFEGTGVAGSGDGIHIVGTAGSSNGNSIFNNEMHSTAGDAILIEQGTTNDTLIYHNDIHDAGGWGINIGASSTRAVVYDNTLGNNSSGDITDSGSNSIVKNNNAWLYSTTEGRSLDVTATGAAGIDWANVENPTTAVDLSATDIQLCDTTTTNTDMVGTDNAALAATALTDATWTDARAGYLDELAAANLPTDIAAIPTVMVGTDNAALATTALTNVTWTDARAGYLDELAAANLPADITTIDTEVGQIKTVTDALPDAGALTTIGTDTARLTAVRAAILTDWIDGGRLDLLLDAIKVITDALTAASAAKLALSAGTIVSGAAEAGTLSPTKMTSDLSEATDDHYNGRIIIWTSGVLQNQATDITDYAGATGLLTFTAVTEAPTAADTFIIV